MLETKVQRTLPTEQPRFGGRRWSDTPLPQAFSNRTPTSSTRCGSTTPTSTLIADAGSTVVHNPISNLRLGQRRAAVAGDARPRHPGRARHRRGDLRRHRQRVDRRQDRRPDPQRLRAGQRRWPTRRRGSRRLWHGGARATRRDDLGAVAPGMLADLALVDLHAIAFTPLNDLREQLVHCEDGSDVVLTMVAGRVVAEHGHVTSVDESALLDEARELFAAQAARASGPPEQRRPAVPGLPAHRAPGAPPMSASAAGSPAGGEAMINPADYRYTPLPDRPAGSWPNGAQLAVVVCVGVESYRFGDGHTEDVLPGVPAPDLVNTAWRDYGNRVGAFRIFDLLARPWHSADRPAQHRRLRRSPGRPRGGPQDRAPRSSGTAAPTPTRCRDDPDAERAYLDRRGRRIRARRGRRARAAGRARGSATHRRR